MPPCTTLSDQAEVSAQKSVRSSSATESPRSAASHATAAPATPPPITATSKIVSASRVRSRRIRRLLPPGDHHVARVEGDELVEEGPPAERRIEGGIHFVRGAHLLEGLAGHRGGVPVEVLLCRILFLHRLPMVGVVEYIFEGFGEESAIVVRARDADAVPLEHGPGGGGRVAVARVAEALLVGGEAQPPLQGVAQPALLALWGHEQEVAPGLEDTDHLGDVRLVVLDVLENIDGDHDVEGRALERHFRLAGLDDAVSDEL